MTTAVDFKSTAKRDVFEEGLITIQALRAPNPCLSATISAYVEAHYENDKDRNRLCLPIPLPDNPAGWLHSTLGNMMNQVLWSSEPALRSFITNCRLDGFGAVIRDADTSNPGNAAILEKIGLNSEPAAKNLHRLITQQ